MSEKTLDWKSYPGSKPQKDTWVFVQVENADGVKVIHKEYYLKKGFANNDSTTRFFIEESALLASVPSDESSSTPAEGENDQQQ